MKQNPLNNILILYVLLLSSRTLGCRAREASLLIPVFLACTPCSELMFRDCRAEEEHQTLRVWSASLAGQSHKRGLCKRAGRNFCCFRFHWKLPSYCPKSRWEKIWVDENVDMLGCLEAISMRSSIRLYIWNFVEESLICISFIYFIWILIYFCIDLSSLTYSLTTIVNCISHACTLFEVIISFDIC